MCITLIQAPVPRPDESTYAMRIDWSRYRRGALRKHLINPEASFVMLMSLSRFGFNGEFQERFNPASAGALARTCQEAMSSVLNSARLDSASYRSARPVQIDSCQRPSRIGESRRSVTDVPLVQYHITIRVYPVVLAIKSFFRVPHQTPWSLTG